MRKVVQKTARKDLLPRLSLYFLKIELGSLPLACCLAQDEEGQILTRH
jgi:hypothetical protein